MAEKTNSKTNGKTNRSKHSHKSLGKPESSNLFAIPLGIVGTEDDSHAILCTDSESESFYFSVQDKSSEAFQPINDKVVFKDGIKYHKPGECSDFRFAYNGSLGGKYIATYIHTKGGSGKAVGTKSSARSKSKSQSQGLKLAAKKYFRVTAISKDMFTWKVLSEVPIEHALVEDSIERASAVVVNDYIWEGNSVMYTGGTFITALTSKDLKDFDSGNELLATARLNMFDSDEIRLMGSFLTERGVAVIYDCRKFENPIDNAKGRYTLNVGAMLFDRDNPRRMIWRSEQPLWKSEQSFDYSNKCTPLGVLDDSLGVNSADRENPEDNGLITLYWSFSDGSILAGSLKPFGHITHLKHPDSLDINRHHANPIITPTPLVAWEANGTFNPAAVMDDDGKVHLLYRAIGHDGVSRIGHSSSEDGRRFYRRSLGPVYNPINPKDRAKRISQRHRRYNPAKYTSGGSWGGHEDPRAVRLGDKVYMMYSDFEGWHSVRIAVTSIKLSDLKKERWNWSHPKYLSPYGEVNKNWGLFPEKIKGKYAILHSLSPRIQIAYVDHIDHSEDHDTPDEFISDGVTPHGGRAGHWDNWVRGLATPPIKTDLGWLILYHAMDRRDPDKYKLGAMILDSRLGPGTNPKILYRAPSPILSPEMCYENDGKPGVVYATGSVVKDGELYIYYGGGDRTVCLAHTPLTELLTWLVDYGKI